jgi:hypothetical protein
MRHLAVAALVVVSFVPRSAAAQSLAEAARRADEARRTSPGTSRVFTNKDLVGNFSNDAEKISNHEITMRNFQAFMSTRRAYATMLVADPLLRGRMQVRLANAKSIDAAVAAWDPEPAVLALIQANGTTPREFLLTELAVAQAVLIMQAQQANSLTEQLSPIVERNVTFVKAQWPVIQAFSNEVMAIASQVQ